MAGRTRSISLCKSSLSPKSIPASGAIDRKSRRAPAVSIRPRAERSRRCTSRLPADWAPRRPAASPKASEVQSPLTCRVRPPPSSICQSAAIIALAAWELSSGRFRLLLASTPRSAYLEPWHGQALGSHDDDRAMARHGPRGASFVAVITLSSPLAMPSKIEQGHNIWNLRKFICAHSRRPLAGPGTECGG